MKVCESSPVTCIQKQWSPVNHRAIHVGHFHTPAQCPTNITQQRKYNKAIKIRFFLPAWHASSHTRNMKKEKETKRRIDSCVNLIMKHNPKWVTLAINSSITIAMTSLIWQDTKPTPDLCRQGNGSSELINFHWIIMIKQWIWGLGHYSGAVWIIGP